MISLNIMAICNIGYMCALWARLFDDIINNLDTELWSEHKEGLVDVAGLLVASSRNCCNSAHSRARQLFARGAVMWYPIGDCSCSRNLYFDQHP